MSHTLTIRLTNELAEWLSAASKRSRLPQGLIIREQLEKARAAEKQGFMRLAGMIHKSEYLSSRRGFSKP